MENVPSQTISPRSRVQNKITFVVSKTNVYIFIAGLREYGKFSTSKKS